MPVLAGRAYRHHANPFLEGKSRAPQRVVFTVGFARTLLARDHREGFRLQVAAVFTLHIESHRVHSRPHDWTRVLSSWPVLKIVDQSAESSSVPGMVHGAGFSVYGSRLDHRLTSKHQASAVLNCKI